MSLNPGDQIGGYRILSQLGSGAMGMVYRAHQIALQRDVALKVMIDECDPAATASRRFRREMELHMGLSHPNLVTVLDAGTDAGRQYLVMELVEGGCLAGLARQRGALVITEALGSTRQVAQALEYLHAQSVVHRDVKPANVLIDRTGRLKLSDFGLARGDNTTMLTAASQLLGTPRYMAPEVMMGDPSSSASDVYSLGVLPYVLLAGRFPFQAVTIPELVTCVTSRDPTPLREVRGDLGADLEARLMELIALFTAGRVNWPQELRAELEELVRTAHLVVQLDPAKVPFDVARAKDLSEGAKNAIVQLGRAEQAMSAPR